MARSLFAVIFLGVLATAASAFDAKELTPCKPAAQRYCDHADMEASVNNLLRCGAVLATVREHVGERCREVLRRYGQL
jgi:hypothetical protein